MLQAASTSTSNSQLGVYNLYSVLPALSMTTTSTANVNITPFTTLVMYELNTGSDPGAMFRNTVFTALKSADVGTAETTVRNRLSTSLAASASSKLAAVPTGFSMMYGSFAVGDVYDVALDSIGKITAYPASGGATLQVTGQSATTYTTTSVSSTPTAKSVQLLLSNTQMVSSGTTPVTLTAVVLDSNKQTMVGRTVTFSITDPDTTPTAYISNVSGVSDANGIVTAKLNLGATKSNRKISVIATADSISAPTGDVWVTGTNLAISGNTSMALNASSTLTIILKDSLGAPVPGVTLAVTSQNGNAIVKTPTSGITDANGQITVTVTATNTGNDLLTVAGAGVTQTQALTVSSSSFVFTTPAVGAVTISIANPALVTAASHGLVAGTPILFTTTGVLPTGIVAGQTYYVLSSGLTANAFTFSATAGGSAVATSGTQSGTHTLQAVTPEILVNAATPVSVLWTINGVVQAGTVNFYTSRGTITGGTITASSSATVAGIATVNVSAASTGATIITASGPSGTPAATLNVVFITTSASAITAQASPSTVAVNASGSTVNQSVISVIVRDANQNLVKNAHVVFSQVADPSGGSLATNTAITDITGTASVNYIAGTTTTTQQNGVQISATVDTVNGVPVTVTPASVSLTVASQSLFVRLGTDNIIYPNLVVSGTYTKKYTALVSDAAGNPAPDGTQVRFVLRPRPSPKTSFSKGFYSWDATNNIWVQTETVKCITEDVYSSGSILAYNGVLDTISAGITEDTVTVNGNGNGFLDPVGVAAVNTTATTTGGFAIATITYPKDHANWVTDQLEARAGTIGNDPPNVVDVPLPILASDLTSLSVPPPGVISPYGKGVGASCLDTN
jgi:hypothetical protein